MTAPGQKARRKPRATPTRRPGQVVAPVTSLTIVCVILRAATQEVEIIHDRKATYSNPPNESFELMVGDTVIAESIGLTGYGSAKVILASFDGEIATATHIRYKGPGEYPMSDAGVTWPKNVAIPINLTL